MLKPKHVVQRRIGRSVKKSLPVMFPYKADLCINENEVTNGWTRVNNATIIVDTKSPYQRIQIIDTKNFGKCMLLDNTVQYCTSDIELYTRKLVERPMKESGKQKMNILIIGGADTWTVNYLLLKYKNRIQHVTLVDIDKQVSDLTREYFGSYFKSDPFKNPLVTIIYSNASTWIKDGVKEKFDLVIIDCTDNTAAVSKLLYTAQFYKNLYQLVKPNGRVVQQMNTDNAVTRRFYQQCKRSWRQSGFKQLKIWKVPIPSFSGDSVYWMAKK